MLYRRLFDVCEWPALLIAACFTSSPNPPLPLFIIIVIIVGLAEKRDFILFSFTPTSAVSTRHQKSSLSCELAEIFHRAFRFSSEGSSSIRLSSHWPRRLSLLSSGNSLQSPSSSPVASNIWKAGRCEIAVFQRPSASARRRSNRLLVH